MPDESELTDEQFLALSGEIEKVPLPGGFIYMRGMTGTERDQWEQTVFYHRSKSPVNGYENFRASLVVRCACRKDRTRRFTDKDVERVGKVYGVHIDKLWDVGARLSGVTEEAANEIGKNLQAGPSDVSSES